MPRTEQRKTAVWFASCWRIAYSMPKAGTERLWEEAVVYFRDQFWESTRGWSDSDRVSALREGWPDCPPEVAAEAVNVREVPNADE